MLPGGSDGLLLDANRVWIKRHASASLRHGLSRAHKKNPAPRGPGSLRGRATRNRGRVFGAPTGDASHLSSSCRHGNTLGRMSAAPDVDIDIDEAMNARRHAEAMQVAPAGIRTTRPRQACARRRGRRLSVSTRRSRSSACRSRRRPAYCGCHQRLCNCPWILLRVEELPVWLAPGIPSAGGGSSPPCVAEAPGSPRRFRLPPLAGPTSPVPQQGRQDLPRPRRPAWRRLRDRGHRALRNRHASEGPGPSAPRRAGSRARHSAHRPENDRGPAPDQGDAQDPVEMKRAFVQQPVIAQHVAVVRQEHDDGVVSQSEASSAAITRPTCSSTKLTIP